jgi:receptor expression-enhancing protein 5/6
VYSIETLIDHVQCSHDLPQLTKYPMLTQAEQRTNVPKTYIVLGGAALVFILHSINALAMPVSNLVGLLVPAFLSFKAIESPSNQDDVQYLTYWIVFAALNFTESFALRLVLYYVPWYFALKSVFVMWLYLPQFRVRNPRCFRLTCISHIISTLTGCPEAVLRRPPARSRRCHSQQAHWCCAGLRACCFHPPPRVSRFSGASPSANRLEWHWGR